MKKTIEMYVNRTVLEQAGIDTRPKTIQPIHPYQESMLYLGRSMAVLQVARIDVNKSEQVRYFLMPYNEKPKVNGRLPAQLKGITKNPYKIGALFLEEKILDTLASQRSPQVPRRD